MSTKLIYFILIPVLIVITGLYFLGNNKKNNVPIFNKESENRKFSVTSTQNKVSISPTISFEEIKKVTEAKSLIISLKNKTFNPPSLKIKAGDQVVWKNEDTITYDIKGDGWGGITLNAGGKMTKVFEKTGKYSYRCTLFPGMNAEITVE